MTILQQLVRFIQPLRRQIASLVAKAVLEEYRHDGKMPLLRIQLGANEVRDNVEMVQPYGFASRPEPGAEVVPVFLNGNRDHGVAIVVDSSGDRIKLNANGDVAIFRSTGEQVYLSAGKVVVKADNIELGEGTLKKLMTETAMSVYNSHTHSVPLPSPTTPTLTTTPVPVMSDLTSLTSKTKGV